MNFGLKNFKTCLMVTSIMLMRHYQYFQNQCSCIWSGTCAGRLLRSMTTCHMLAVMDIKRTNLPAHWTFPTVEHIFVLSKLSVHMNNQSSVMQNGRSYNDRWQSKNRDNALPVSDLSPRSSHVGRAHVTPPVVYSSVTVFLCSFTWRYVPTSPCAICHQCLLFLMSPYPQPSAALAARDAKFPEMLESTSLLYLLQ